MTLETPQQVEAELAATADYDVANDVGKAKRRVAALRRKLDFAAMSSEDGRSVQFQLQITENQLRQALAFVQANDSQSEAQRLANPNVTHADFSTFGQYAGGSSSNPEDLR